VTTPERRRRKLSFWFVFTGLAGVLVGILSLGYLSAGLIYDYEDTVSLEQLPDVDVIVCLAGGKGRINSAAELWYRYYEQILGSRVSSNADADTPLSKTPILYLSGLGHKADWNSVAKQINPQVAAVLPKHDVVLESFSGNTDENAQWFAKALRDHGWKKVLLITSTYHMKRARFILEHVLKPYGPIEVETWSVRQDPFAPHKWQKDLQGIQVTLTEFFKWVMYRVFWEPGAP